MESLPPKHPLFDDIHLGIGTWAWGDRMYWGYGHDYHDQDLWEAFRICIENGVTFFDTAEIYGQGKSEELLGSFAQESGRTVIIASKFVPYPWRFRRANLIEALKKSLKRLKVPRLDLYQMHIYSPPVPTEVWMDAMVEAVQSGLIQAVGVSNYNRQQMERAYNRLQKEGIPLASNQVEYHLLNRRVELNGLLTLCHEMGVTLIAYSPLAMGLLTGKYSSENPMSGFRGRRMARLPIHKIQPLLTTMKRIGANHDGRPPAQVALNWIIQKNALPIPGVKNPAQAKQNLAALHWSLTQAEMEELDQTSQEVTHEPG